MVCKCNCPCHKKPETTYQEFHIDRIRRIICEKDVTIPNSDRDDTVSTLETLEAKVRWIATSLFELHIISQSERYWKIKEVFGETENGL